MRRGAVVVDEGLVGDLTEAVAVVGSVEGLAEAVVAGVNTVDAFVAENIDVGTTPTSMARSTGDQGGQADAGVDNGAGLGSDTAGLGNVAPPGAVDAILGCSNAWPSPSRRTFCMTFSGTPKNLAK